MDIISHKWKYAGIPMIFAGLVLLVFTSYFNIKITIPVFAVFSRFIETKYFAVFKTNFTDELIMLLLLGGLFLFVFSKERENDQSTAQRKGKAMYKACFYNCLVLFFSILFLYGQGFVAVMVLNMFSTLILFLFFFYFTKRKIEY